MLSVYNFGAYNSRMDGRNANDARHYETEAEARRCMDYIADVNGTYNL